MYLLLIFSISITGCTKNSSTKPEYVIDFRVKISNTDNQNISINIPIPYGWDEFEDNIKIEVGNPILKIEKTNYGDSIKIKCNETIEIKAYKKSNEPLGFKNLSMTYIEKRISYIYLNSTSLNINIPILLECYYNVYSNDFTSEIGYIIDGELETGWNEEKVIDTHGE